MLKNRYLSMATLLLISTHLNANENMILDDIVITATQNPELNSHETPVLSDVISAESMNEKSISSLHELFEQTPGVDAKTAGPGSVMPMIRGLSDEQVLVLVDGVRLSDERPGGNHILSINPKQIERVEIVKGSGSVLYGAGAIGGVVNFITKKAKKSQSETLEISGEVGAGYESNQNAKDANLHLEAASKDLSFYLGADKRKTDNIQSPDEEIKFSDYDGETYWGGVAYTKENWSAEINGWQTEADIGITAPRTFKSDYYKDEKQSMLNSKVTYKGDGNFLEQFDLQLGWQEHNRHRIREPKEGSLVDINVDKESKTARAQFVLKPNDAHRITTGVDTFDESLSSTRVMKNLPPAAKFNGVPVMAPSTRTGVGVFVQDETEIGENIKITTGLRYDTTESKTEGSAAPYFITNQRAVTNDDISGSLGVVYKLDEMSNLYANIGRAFRSPTLIERYFFGPHDAPGQDKGNPDLKAETSLNSDIGLRLGSEKYQASLGFFYNRVDNMIRKILTNPNVTPAQYIYEYQNIHDARLYGMEFDGAYYFNDSLSAFASLNLADGENTTDNRPLNGIAPLRTRYGLEYYGMLEAYESVLGLSAETVLKKEESELGIAEKSTPSYTTFDLYASFIQEEGVNVSLRIDNLFDRTTYDFLSYGYQALDYASMGRNVKVMMDYKF
ncbi:MAG TPA: TonB-dependent receptor [Campylobacterales bacterium]|nr:TonB-dependent receptor [Campylobacterales bacterium]